MQETVSSIYDHICRISFFERGEYFVFRKDTKPTKEEMIVDEIRALFFKGEADKAYHAINYYFIEDINIICRHALTFCGEDIQNAYFKKEIRQIRKFYDSLYECIDSSIPHSFENLDFEKWNSFYRHMTNEEIRY